MTDRANTYFKFGSRFYIHPESGEKQPGVTSIISSASAKPFLQAWNAKLVAEFAVDNMPIVGPLAAVDRQAAIDLLKGAPKRYTAKAGDLGTEVHAAFEVISGGGKLGHVSPTVTPFVRHFDEFCQQWQPEFLFREETLWNSTVGYAGSADAFVKIQGETIVLDFKTGKSVYPEVGLQLSAYRGAEEMLSEGSVPQTTGGAVLHIRPEGWSLIPIKCDEEIFDVFVHMVHVFNWANNLSRTVVGRKLEVPIGKALKA